MHQFASQTDLSVFDVFPVVFMRLTLLPPVEKSVWISFPRCTISIFLGLFPAHKNVSFSPYWNSAPGIEFSYDIYTPSSRFVTKIVIKTIFSCNSVSASLPGPSAQ